MKNTIQLNGELVMPIRAIPAHTPGMFDPRDVIDMLCRIEGYPDAPLLRPLHVTSDGQVVGMHPAQFLDAYTQLHSDEAPEGLDGIRLLPRGVLVRVAEIKEMYEFLDGKLFERDSKYGYQEVPRAWVDEPITDAEEEVVFFEGINGVINTPVPSTTPVKKGRSRDGKGIDKTTQMCADEAARDYIVRTGSKPTKKQLVDVIIKRSGTTKSPETVIREFHVTW